MINEKDKKIIDKFLKEQNFDFDKYDDFIEYIQARGMLNDNVKLLDKVFFTQANLNKLYSDYINPIRRVAKQFGFTYKELAEKIGYSESGLKNVITNKKISEPMKKSLELLIENAELKHKLKLKSEAMDNLKTYLKDFIEKID